MLAISFRCLRSCVPHSCNNFSCFRLTKSASCHRQFKSNKATNVGILVVSCRQCIKLLKERLSGYSQNVVSAVSLAITRSCYMTLQTLFFSSSRLLPSRCFLFGLSVVSGCSPSDDKYQIGAAVNIATEQSEKQ